MTMYVYLYFLLLLQDSQNRTALHSAVLAGNFGVITHLHDLSVDAKDSHGNTPVHLGTKTCPLLSPLDSGGSLKFVIAYS